jgi:hypothetical protein
LPNAWDFWIDLLLICISTILSKPNCGKHEVVQVTLGTATFCLVWKQFQKQELLFSGEKKIVVPVFGILFRPDEK